MLSGGNDTTFVKYQLAVLNGTGINNLEDNVGKDYVGRVVLQPFKFFSVGASYKLGSNAPADATVTKDDTHTRLGIETQIQFGNFHAQAEYVYAKDEGSYYEGGGCGGVGELVVGDIERRGFYAMADYMFEDMGLQACC